MPRPQRSKSFRSLGILRPLNLSRYAFPAPRASLKVRYAPITAPAVAAPAYSYQGLRRLATRMARRMSGPPKVGSGVPSRIAKKNNPNAPRCRKAASALLEFFLLRGRIDSNIGIHERQEYR